MFIQNPPFLSEQPRPAAQAAVLLVLLMAALPLAMNLPVSIMLMFTALLTARLLLIQIGRSKTPPAALLILLVASGALVWTQLGALYGREGGISFLLLMVVLKAFESQTRRDWQVLLLAMLILIGTGVLFNQSLSVGLWVLLNLFGISICFGMLGGLTLKNAAQTGMQALLLTLPLMVVLFIAAPRKSEPLWRIPQPSSNQAKTGLSDTMKPGSISNLVQSDEWVANITFTNRVPKPEEMYWRAIVMTEFDGTTWRAPLGDTTDDSSAKPDQAHTLSYQMILRDQNGVIPALDYPSGALPQGIVRRTGNVLRAERSRESLRRVSLEAQTDTQLFEPLTPAVANFYRRLPQGNTRTRILAQNLAQQSSGPRDFIQKTLNYYRRNTFSYTLQPPLTEGNNSIDAFMFETKQGFCEHYAQSFVVMMRAAGLPARVVTGYQGAEYISEGRFWQIRAKNAHAWAEVWLPEERIWLRVDPTAAVSSQRISSGLQQALPQSEQNLIHNSDSLSQWRETGQYYWQQWVVNYDQSRQNSLFAQLGLGGFNFGNFILVLGLGGLLALVPIALWWRKGRRNDQNPLQEGFALLKTALFGEDDDTRHGLTAAELREMMQQNGMGNHQLQDLLKQYEYWQYAADQAPKPAEQHAWLARVRKALKAYAKNP
ncbi:MAG: DUF3488 and transglutaminase-like domain-containing protein [Neisseria sp.]|uniref:transglutaminase family protein n=1 Tax=Neisseria sp. TaxID=192066 RepID=UPI0026DCDCFF|nr:DUF3488 and transglutaminase-like domain-containing protein [Neisseria sp.]MDO4641374.1 DUF3488 and transglutaminase-like domain-containing protein [Neisseria sp.]